MESPIKPGREIAYQPPKRVPVEKELSDLQLFLQEQQRGGRFVDSSQFTLDSLKARQKLAEFQLPEAGLWLVKLVQAAVVWESTSVRITFSRRQVQVEFSCPPSLEADAILHLVLSGEFPRDRAQAHLVTGIRACSGLSTESVQWSAGESQVALDAAGTRVWPGSQDSVGIFRLVATRPTPRRSLSKTLATSVSHWLRATADEYEAVSTRCWVSPIPIFLDGKPLQRSYDSLLQRGLPQNPGAVIAQMESRQNPVQVCLGVRMIPELPGRPQLPVIDPGAEEHEWERPVYIHGTYLRWRGLQGPAGGALVVRHDKACSSGVDWVSDGAVVSRTPLHWDLRHSHLLGALSLKYDCSARFILGVSPDELDLSQFEVRDKQALTQRLVAESLPYLEELLEELLGGMPSFWYLPFSSRFIKVVGAGLVGQVGWLTVSLGALATVPTAFLVGAVGAANMLVFRKLASKALTALLKHVQSLRQPVIKQSPFCFLERIGGGRADDDRIDLGV